MWRAAKQSAILAMQGSWPRPPTAGAGGSVALTPVGRNVNKHCQGFLVRSCMPNPKRACSPVRLLIVACQVCSPARKSLPSSHGPLPIGFADWQLRKLHQALFLLKFFLLSCPISPCSGLVLRDPLPPSFLFTPCSVQLQRRPPPTVHIPVPTIIHRPPGRNIAPYLP